MKGNPIEYQDLVVYPEYCELTVDELRKASTDGKYHVAALPTGGKNWTFVCNRGKVIWERAKYRLYFSESEGGMAKGQSRPRCADLGLRGIQRNVLILICYEIMFPEDYLLQNMGNVDLVIHMIGQPMFDENQREGWVALQKVISMLYERPVVCCCGGEQGHMNLTGVIGSRKE